MFDIEKIPMYPPALVIVFVLGLLWLLQIALSNEKNKYEEEKQISDYYYIYPVVMMCYSVVCFVYQYYIGNVAPDVFSPFF